MRIFILALALFSLLACKEKSESAPTTRMIVSTTPVLDHFVGRLTKGLPGFSHKLAIQTQGKCLHDHAISMDEIRTLCNASLIVANGLEFEPFLEKALVQCPQVPVFHAFEGCSPLPLAEEDHHEEHGDQHDEDHHHGGEFDPHAWFGSKQVDCMLQNLSGALLKLDSTHKDSLLAKAKITRSEIQTFWTEAKSKYAALQGKEVVVFHSSYNYFMQEFGLHAIASVSEELEEATPSAKESAALIQTIEKHSVQILLAGESELPEIAHMIAKESGARLVPMLTMLETMDSTDPLAYEHILAENLRRIQP